MNKSFFCFLLTIGLLFACSKEQGIDTATDSNLEEISQKLANLKIDKIQQQQQPDANQDLSGEFSLAGTAKTPKILKTENNISCQHQESISEKIEGDQIETTIKYFDIKKNPITSCDVDYKEYITKETSIITGSNYVYNTNSTTQYKESINYVSSLNSASFKSEIYSTLTGLLNFNGDIFNIVEGSHFKVNTEFNFNNLSENLDNLNIPIELDVLYKIEFNTNGKTYHFDVTLDENDILLFEETNKTFETKYLLFNSSNKKIGTVKYVYNDATNTERFELYDLVGNKI